MMIQIENLTTGQTFRMLGVQYRLVRNTGKVVDTPKRNNWGRLVGGTYKAHKLVVEVDRLHRGWSSPHYTVFPVGSSVVVD